jgi:hypothetical protein
VEHKSYNSERRNIKWNEKGGSARSSCYRCLRWADSGWECGIGSTGLGCKGDFDNKDQNGGFGLGERVERTMH